MRYVIIGAGAVGGVLGARLAQHSPHQPLLIARGDHGRAIADRGLLLRSPDGEATIRADVAARPEDVTLHIDDVLVFATKTQSVEGALREWVDQPVYDGDHVVGTSGELLPAFMALNGVESERLAQRFFDRVFGVCVWLPAVYLTAGEVAVQTAPSSGTFIIGRYGPPPVAAPGTGTAAAAVTPPVAATGTATATPARSAQVSRSDAELLETLSADWTAATFRIFLVDDVMRWKYRKLLANLGNAIAALLGPKSSASELRVRLRGEAEHILRTAGITWPSDREEEEWRADAFDILPVDGLGAVAGSSWQSIQRGTQSIETDYLNGEIVLLARSLGLDAPLNAVMQRLARRAAAGHPTTRAALEADLTAAAP